MVGVLDGGRLGEALDRLRQQVCEVGDGDALRYLRFGQRLRRGASRVDDRLFPLDLLPLERLLRAVDVEALAVLPRGREQTARHLRGDVRISKLERGGFNRERTAVLRNQVLLDTAGPVTDHVLGMLPGQREAR